eukprot:gene24944-30418_t
MPRVKPNLCRYVDLIPDVNVGPAEVFVSHGWRSNFFDLVNALATHFQEEPGTFLWMDIFAVNQNPGTAANTLDVDSFEDVIKATQITTFQLDGRGVALTRVWCLYEIWKTLMNENQFEVLTYGLEIGTLEQIFYTVDVENADALLSIDRVRILNDIETTFGFQACNMRIREALVASVRRKAERVLRKKGYGVGPQQINEFLDSAYMHKVSGNFRDGEKDAQTALEVAERIHGSESLLAAKCTRMLAGLLQNQGRHEETVAMYRNSLAVFERFHHGDHPEVASALLALGGVLKNLGRVLEAEPFLERGVQMRENLYGVESPKVAISLDILAQVHLAREKFLEADILYQRSLEIKENEYGKEH